MGYAGFAGLGSTVRAAIACVPALLKKTVTHLTSSCVLRGLSTYNVILVTVIPMLTILRRSYHMIDLDHNLSRFESATETAANGCK